MAAHYQLDEQTQIRLAARTAAFLLPKVFEWARAADPSQPLTSGIWHHDHWENLAGLNSVEKTQLTQSDVISFHDYSWPEIFEARAKALETYGRPVICTEYMARGAGSTFDTILPHRQARQRVGDDQLGLRQRQDPDRHAL